MYRCVASSRLYAATVFIFAGLTGQTSYADVLVSQFSGSGVLRFDDNGLNRQNFSPGTEGVAGRKVGTGCEIFISNNSGTISVFDGAGAPLRTLVISSSGLSRIAAISFSADSSVLYVADYGLGRIFGINPVTGAVLFTGIGPTSTPGPCAWHDVLAAPDGSVYATDFTNANCGVFKFSANLTSFAPFLPGDPGGVAQFARAAGLAFDKNGDLWVTTFSNRKVYQVSTNPLTPGLVKKVVSSSLFDLPLGLALGPNDGNMYVADFRANLILKIDVATGNVTQFISGLSGPKYLWFTQNCTAAAGCGANPLQALAGTWTFATDGSGVGTPYAPAGPFASAGQFVASVGTRGGSPIGLLSIVSTSSQGGQTVRLESDAGSFQLFPDCSGGTLTFNLSTRGLTFDFWFTKGGTEISFVSTTPGVTLRGTASRGVSSCPAGTSPLQTFAGKWVYSSEGFLQPPNVPFSAAGIFQASVGIRSGSPAGLLAVTSTSIQNGQSTGLEQSVGLYQVFPDCSGGTLQLNYSGRPQTFDFWFAMGGDEIRFVSTTSGVTIFGSATH